MTLSALGFSMMGGLVKKTFGSIPPTEAVFFRAFVALPILIPWMAYKKIPFFGQNNRILLLRSLAGFTALCLNFIATAKIPLAEASILNQTSPFFVAILSSIFLSEKVSSQLWFLIVLAFIGTLLIVNPTWGEINIFSLMGLSSGFFAAVAYVSIRQLHKSDSPFTMVFNFMLLSSVLSLLLFHRHFIQPSLTNMIFLIGAGIVGTLAQLAMTEAYKHAPASVVSPYSFCGVLFSALWGVFFWGELPGVVQALGGILIIFCGVGIAKIKTPE